MTPKVERGHYQYDYLLSGRKPKPTLIGQAIEWDWPTATAADSKDVLNRIRGNLSLAGAAHDWPTPTLKGNDNKAGLTKRSRDGLQVAAADWPTPKGSADKLGQARPKDRGDLQAAAADWPTPRAISGGGESAVRKKELGRIRAGGGDLQSAVQEFPSLPTHQPSLFIHPDERTSKPGDGCLSSTPPSRRLLNPRFTEWLMGWPIGSTVCGCSEMEWSRWRQLSRSCLCFIVCARHSGGS